MDISHTWFRVTDAPEHIPEYKRHQFHAVVNATTMAGLLNVPREAVAESMIRFEGADSAVPSHVAVYAPIQPGATPGSETSVASLAVKPTLSIGEIKARTTRHTTPLLPASERKGRK